MTTAGRGAFATLATGLGYAAASDLGPTPGNGFGAHWSDDLSALAELGCPCLRLTIDWSRLQPDPRTVDGTWVEWYHEVLAAAADRGIEVWATLFERAVPRWFADEGGFGDDRASARWWPRWVDAAAERFGDEVTAWIPMTSPADHALRARPDDATRRGEMLANLARAWRDTWSILRGGPPVATSADDDVTPADTDRCDLVGIAAHLTIDDRDPDRFTDVLHRAAERGDGRPLVVTSVDVASLDGEAVDRDGQAEVLAAVRAAIDAATTDGIVVAAFAAPAVDGGDDEHGLLDRDRRLTPAGEAWWR